VTTAAAVLVLAFTPAKDASPAKRDSPVLERKMGLPPRLRQTVKTLHAVR
jgi:hypothetical protein